MGFLNQNDEGLLFAMNEQKKDHFSQFYTALQNYNGALQDVAIPFMNEDVMENDGKK